MSYQGTGWRSTKSEARNPKQIRATRSRIQESDSPTAFRWLYDSALHHSAIHFFWHGALPIRRWQNHWGQNDENAFRVTVMTDLKIRDQEIRATFLPPKGYLLTVEEGQENHLDIDVSQASGWKKVLDD